MEEESTEEEISDETFKTIFLEVMATNKITAEHIPVEDPFKYSRRKVLEKSSARYFAVKGFAKFSCPQHRVWPSAHSWCFVDLKAQSICHRYTQSCKRCNYKVEPRYVDEDVVLNMAQYVVNQFLYRIGWKTRPKRSKDARITNNKPHDTRRCSRCKDKKRNCSGRSFK